MPLVKFDETCLFEFLFSPPSGWAPEKNEFQREITPRAEKIYRFRLE